MKEAFAMQKLTFFQQKMLVYFQYKHFEILTKR